MSAYALILFVCGVIVLVCQLAFIILFRPGWRVLGLWWINIALYAQAIALAGLGLRTALIYWDRLDVATTLSEPLQITSLLLALVAAFGSIVFITGYLMNRSWGQPGAGRKTDA